MKTNPPIFFMLCLVCGLIAANASATPRDPFWPIGYVPLSERQQKKIAEANADSAKTAQASEESISDSDWAKARKLISIHGVTRSTNPATKEVRTLVMINRQTFAVGDTVSVVFQNIRFHWRVASISDQGATLDPAQAERIPPRPAKTL
jgi:hypothetical protein